MTPDDPVPADLLQSQDPDLCKWLCRYVMETQRTDGSLCNIEVTVERSESCNSLK